ncbi:Pyruvate decarboxylase 2 [Morella rubra]|uniref:pyruvate decarboxylase n=1 Tax=Morella rubra TaxID=262757 RepID=A0A6A1WI49_9ROSI|nr:Pyruvate decarboxylase 2 [Morella rubra]
MGSHLARRLAEIGVRDVFSVPGDFNLTLLDYLIAEPQLNLVGCCNELNAGYAADGYARAKGVGACVVTFTVGGLSVINAIAGAYSENLPVICIVGGPNSNDYGTNRILHHTIGLPDFSQEHRCFQTVTCFQAVVNNLEDAHEQIDTAISTALKESKPVYISISCNLAGIPYPTFSREPVPFLLAPKVSNQVGLEAAVEAAAEFLNKAVKPVIVGGPKLRVAKAQKAFVELADASGIGTGRPGILFSAPVPPKQTFSVPALAPRPGLVTLLCLGVGFLLKNYGLIQVTAQDISTMIRCGQRTIIFLINNGGYTIEVEIHDGPYNVIKNWDYTGLVDAIHNGEGKCWTTKVRTETELTEAIATATGAEKDSLCFIEVFVHKDDTSKELLEWGSRVSSANSRLPNPQ